MNTKEDREKEREKEGWIFVAAHRFAQRHHPGENPVDFAENFIIEQRTRPITLPDFGRQFGPSHVQKVS